MKRVKVYGVVSGLANNSNGLVYAKVKDLNDTSKEHLLCSGSNINNFNGTELKKGMRIGCTGEGQKVLLIVDDIKIYDEVYRPSQSKDRKDLAIRLGNAINVADNLCENLEDVLPVAKDLVLPKAEKLTREIIDRYRASMDDYSIKARLGQCLLLASKHIENVTEETEPCFSSLVVDDVMCAAEKLFDEICEVEKELL